jgi:hypothetical protein
VDGLVVLMWDCLKFKFRPTAHFSCFVLRGYIGYMAGQLYLLTTKDGPWGGGRFGARYFNWLDTESRHFLPHMQLHYRIAHSSIALIRFGVSGWPSIKTQNRAFGHLSVLCLDTCLPGIKRKNITPRPHCQGNRRRLATRSACRSHPIPESPEAPALPTSTPPTPDTYAALVCLDFVIAGPSSRSSK